MTAPFAIAWSPRLLAIAVAPIILAPIILAAFILAAVVARAEATERVVSMTLRTDQLAMLIADKSQLASVSRLALQPEVTVLHADAPFFVDGYTAGAGPLPHDAMHWGGWRNAAVAYGDAAVDKLPLEVMASASPDAFVADERSLTGVAPATEVLRHPALGILSQRGPIRRPSDAVTICGAPFTTRAVRQVAAARAAVAGARPAAAVSAP